MVTPSNPVRFVSRGGDAYTMYVHDLPVAVIIKVAEKRWHGMVFHDMGDFIGPSRASVAAQIAPEGSL